DWPVLIWAPGCTISRTRSPCSMFSPNSGSLNSITAQVPFVSWLRPKNEKRGVKYTVFACVMLAESGIRLLRIDPQFLYGAFHDVGSDLLLPCKGSEGRKHDVLGIDLKKIAKCCTVFTTPEPICTQRHKLSRHPLAQTLRQYLHVVGGCDEGSLGIFQRLRD